MRKSVQNQIYNGSNNRKALYDLEVPKNYNGIFILFIHGYMGFKDWGAWNLMQDYFTSFGFGFCKFNFTHNGIGLNLVEEFTELEAFSENNYMKELEDVSFLYQEIQKDIPKNSKFAVIGHSRGGGIAILSSKNIPYNYIITLASISSIEKRYEDTTMISKWEKNGIRYVKNQRTNQEMPHSYSQYQNYLENKEVLSIKKALTKFYNPCLIIHGEKDSSVLIQEGKELASWSKTNLKTVVDADHVFGAKHPWNKKELPEILKSVCVLISDFLK